MIYGKRGLDYLISSESVSLDCLNFNIIDDIKPGETIIFKINGDIKKNITSNIKFYTPCLFEYIYLSRPDSIIDNILVYNARINMGRSLGKKIKNMEIYKKIDIITYIPYTSRISALGVSLELNIPLHDIIIRNRYVDRTFIMPNQEIRIKSINRKLNIIGSLIKNKNILIIDDSIVRGNTAKNIISRIKKFNPKTISFASIAPIIKYENIYGIDIPTKNELISYNKDLNKIKEYLDIDNLIYQELIEIENSLIKLNPKLNGFETSCFNNKHPKKNYSIK